MAKNVNEEREEEKRQDPTKGVDVETQEQGADAEPREKVVPVDAPDVEDSDENSGPTPRQQRRKARYDEMQAKNAELERRAIEAEHRAAAALAYTQFTQQQQKPAADPLEEEGKQIKSDWEKHLAHADILAKGSTPEQRKQWQDEHFAIEERGRNLAARRAVREAGQSQRSNPQEDALRTFVNANFPDVASNPRALRFADGLMNQKLAREGRDQATLPDWKAVLEDTRRGMRLPGASPAPSDATRQKFSGGGLGGASGSGGGGREIRMGKEEMLMAEAMYKTEKDPNTGKVRRLKPAEAHAKWAQKVGKRVVDRQKTG
jgi:hypothetical protein